MYNTMSLSEEDKASRAKLAKLVAAFDEDWSEKCVEAILQTDGDVNYNAITSSVVHSGSSGTILHQLRKLPESKIPMMLKLLLEYKVDVTVKNGEGHTALHAELSRHKYADSWKYASSFDDRQIAKFILSAHVDHSIRQNPCDNNGISHFHIACMAGHQQAVEFFLDNGVDVDKAIDPASPIFPGCSPLHFAVRGGRLETAKKLLEYGANVWSKDAKGSTVVRALIERNLALMNLEVAGAKVDLVEEYEANQRMIRLLLTSNDANNNNSTIVSDEHGFTNFHAACACDDPSLVETMLVHLDDVNRIVNVDSPLWPGYTPLHFAAHFSADLAKLLLVNGGNLASKDANGIAPLDVILQRHRVDDVRDLLAAHSSWRNIAMSDERTKLLDLLGTMRSKDAFKSFLDDHEDAKDLRVDENSPLWPSYSLLHFAVMFSERVSATFHHLRARKKDKKSLVEDLSQGTWLIAECEARGVGQVARRGTRGTRGVGHVARRGTRAPIHLAFYSQQQYYVERALYYVDKGELNELVDDNGLSLLHIACTPFCQHTLAERLVEETTVAEANLPMASSIRLHCQGSRPLADSPLTRFFVVAGSTLLHMAVTAQNVNIARLLLRHGADANATNVEGWSPVHILALMPPGMSVGKAVLKFTANLREQVLEAVGLTHLHVACRVGSLEGAKKLIELGSNVNAVLQFDSTFRTHKYAGCRSALDALRQTDFAGFTPLHFAVRSGSVKIARVLLQAGADVLARNAKGESLLHEVLTMNDKEDEQLVDLFVEHLRGDENLRERLRQESGVTMLHVLAFRMRVVKVEAVDVNAKVREDSSIWPGCTALHVWMQGTKDRDLAHYDVRSTLKLLLDAGADVTMADKMLDTPLHHFDRWFDKIDDEITLSIGRLLLSSQKDFRVNPRNASGISHFHIAVRMRELGCVEEFLKHGVDVNQQVDVLSSSKPGCSALHLLAYGESTYLDGLPARMQTIDLLLRYGADVQARDVLGNTPLHALAKNKILPKELFDMIIHKARGSSLDAVNVAGETPFAVALKSSKASAKEVEFFLNYGCRLNVFNAVDQTGMLASVFALSDRSLARLNELCQALFQNPAVEFVDESGRTAIHNVVSSRVKTILTIKSKTRLIKKLTVLVGLDIDAQDRSGKTALHTAALFKNERGVSALLVHGADVNILDNDGKTAFDYALDPCTCTEQAEHHYHKDVITSFSRHLQKLRLLKLDVHERNENLFRRATTVHTIDVSVSTFLNQVESTSHMEILESKKHEPHGDSRVEEIKDSLRLKHFLSETGAVSTYWTMSCEKRQAILKYFKSDPLEEIGEVWGLLKLQCRKAAKRVDLIEKAFESLWILSGIRVPELCCECLLEYLSLCDVESMIAATPR